jgi:RNA polymerase sigma-70 factor (ECF subfamily)
VDDRQLVERVRRGDEEALATVYARHQAAIYRYALHMCGAAAADDIVQDTFVALLRRPRGYEASRGPLVSYLFGIARHHVAKRLTAMRAELLLLDDDPDAAMNGAVAPDDTPLEAFSRGELVAQVRDAIRSLPLAYREVVVLCELNEMDYAAASAVIERPIGTVRSRLHRAKAMLMTKLRSSADGCRAR